MKLDDQPWHGHLAPDSSTTSASPHAWASNMKTASPTGWSKFGSVTNLGYSRRRAVLCKYHGSNSPKSEPDSDVYLKNGDSTRQMNSTPCKTSNQQCTQDEDSNCNTTTPGPQEEEEDVPSDEQLDKKKKMEWQTKNVRWNKTDVINDKLKSTKVKEKQCYEQKNSDSHQQPKISDLKLKMYLKTNYKIFQV